MLKDFSESTMAEEFRTDSEYTAAGTVPALDRIPFSRRKASHHNVETNIGIIF